MRRFPFLPSLLLSVLLLVAGAIAHPIPDVPVRASFDETGRCLIQVEIDPRCFEEDPNIALSEKFEDLQAASEAKRAEWKRKARAFVQSTVELFFEPLGRIAPEFEFEFTAHGGAPLVKPDDVMVLTGSWRTSVPAGIQGYRIRALPGGKLSVLFLNSLRGQSVERIAVLFPGETSFVLDLNGLTATTPTGPMAGAVGQKSGAGGWWATFFQFLREGFLHVVPFGLDHILFVLGLFLLSREWRPLLWQVTMFTAAHTLTLGLATFGKVSVPASIVEPIIAASIAVVAMENIFRPRYTHWRLVVVFAFGLVHGLGFAGALKALDLPTASLVVGLLGFNVGVECGQLTVIALAFVATFWIHNPQLYRRAVVVPGSLMIAALGLWWMAQRAGWV